MMGEVIAALWFLIAIILLLSVVWLGLYIIKLFVLLPDSIERAIWMIVLILCFISALNYFAGSGRLPRVRILSGGAFAAERDHKMGAEERRYEERQGVRPRCRHAPPHHLKLTTFCRDMPGAPGSVLGHSKPR